MAVLNISPFLPVDGVDVVDAASVSVPMLQIEDAYLSHVTNIASDGYAPEHHLTGHISVASNSMLINTASNNAPLGLDVALSQITTRIHAIEGDGAASWGAGAAVASLVTLNNAINGTDLATPNTLVKRDATGASAFKALGINFPQSETSYLSLYNLTGTTGSSAKSNIFKLADSGPTPLAGYYVDQTLAYYNANNTATSVLGGPYGVGMTVNGHTVDIGLSNPFVTSGSPPAQIVAPAYGSVLGFQSYMVLHAVGHIDNEYSPYAGTTRFDTTAAGGRIWATDFHGQSGVGVQPQALGGVHFTVKNTYNGSPSGTTHDGINYDATGVFRPTGTITNSPATGFAATALAGATGYILPYGNHVVSGVAATTYPADIGYWAGGSSGTNAAQNQTQGWRYGFVSGAIGGNYGGVLTAVGNSYSRMGTGFFSRDHENTAFYAYDRFSGNTTGLAFVSSVGAGNSLFGTAVVNPTSANASSTVVIGDNLPILTNQSPVFTVNGGALSATNDTVRRIGTFAVTDTGPTTMMLNLFARRVGSGTGTLNTSFGLAMEHDAATTPDAALWFGINGVAIGPTQNIPLYMLDVGGTIRGTGGIIGGSVDQGAIVDGATITTRGRHTVTVAPTTSVSGIILQSAIRAGESITIINGSVNGITMGLPATSNVVSGAGETIAANSSRTYWYNGAYWYPAGSPNPIGVVNFAGDFLSNTTLSTVGYRTIMAIPAANRTGMILQSGTTVGGAVTVVNQSANSITFAASGTSHVVDGTADVIPATSSHSYFWDGSYWSPELVGAGGAGGGGSLLPGAAATTGKVSKWQDATHLTDSLLSESGSTVTMTGALAVTAAATVGTTLTTTGKVTASGGMAIAGTATTPANGLYLQATNASGDVNWVTLAGGGNVNTGAGTTTGKLTKWSNATTITDSILTETSGTVAVAGNATVSGTLGVTGASTLAALAATTGTFSGALGATTGTFSALLTASAGARIAGTTTTPATKSVLTSTNASGDLDWAAQPYDVGGYFKGLIGASDEDKTMLTRPISIASGATGNARADVAAAVTRTFTLNKIVAGVTSAIGTIIFTGGGSAIGAVSITSTTALAAGDEVQIVAPGTQDSALAGVAWAIRGTLT